jgi:pimeloyl-ACP methyl ester carboxylesterase
MNTINFKEGKTQHGTYWRRYGAASQCPLVMVVGYGGQLATWSDEFVERLARNRDVIIFDHHGSGKSAPLAEDANLSLADFAEHVANLTDELRIEKFDLYGYSMGGCISLEYIRRNPKRVNRLVLTATTAGGKYFHNASEEVAARMRNPRGNTLEEMYFDFLSISMPAAAIEKFRTTLNTICATTCNPATPQHVLTMKLNAFRQFDASDVLAGISCPTLVVHGKNDELVPIANAIQLARHIPNAQQMFFDECGHYPHIEHQDALVDGLNEFLAPVAR